MAELDKEVERDRDEAGTYRAVLESADAKAHRTAYNINGIRERSEGGKADQRATVNRDEASVGRDRDEANRLHNSL